MKILIITLIVFLSAVLASAGKTYSPYQLKDMVKNGNYPKQGKTNTQTKSVSFKACKAAAENVMSQVRGSSYPVEIIVNTNQLYVVKAWTNNGVITVSCSAPDRKMIIGQAAYE